MMRVMTTRRPRSSEAVLLSGAIKLALATLAAAQQTSSLEAARKLTRDAAEGLRIGLEMAQEETQNG